MLAEDTDAYVQKAIGSWVRESGKREQAALVNFLMLNRDRLPRTTFIAAASQLPAKVKEQLLQH